jgi:hypothetical protein
MAPLDIEGEIEIEEESLSFLEIFDYDGDCERDDNLIISKRRGYVPAKD